MELIHGKLLNSIGELECRCRQVLTPLTEEQKTWREEPGTWSPIQCLDHMNVTVELYLPGIRKALRLGHQTQKRSEGPFTLPALDSWFLSQLEPPVGFRFPAPRAFRPAEEPKLQEVQQRYFFLREEMRQLVRSAAGLDLVEIKLPFPTIRWVRICLGTAFAAVISHDRRHFWQIEQLTLKPGFPQGKKEAEEPRHEFSDYETTSV